VTSPNHRLHPSAPRPHHPIVDPIGLHHQACQVFPTSHAAVNVTASPGRAIRCYSTVEAPGVDTRTTRATAPHLAIRIRTANLNAHNRLDLVSLPLLLAADKHISFYGVRTFTS